MQPTISKLARISLGAGVLATALSFSLPAAAETHHTHRHHHFAYGRPLTVTKRHREAVMAPDPFHGPAAIITAPNAVAATVVSLPFRAAALVFPPYGNPAADPLVLIGAPLHAVGYIVEIPFFIVGSAFGAPPNVY
ncbi:MAG: hypothetical protein WA620_01885 [Methylovirgula sp.]